MLPGALPILPHPPLRRTPPRRLHRAEEDPVRIDWGTVIGGMIVTWPAAAVGFWVSVRKTKAHVTDTMNKALGGQQVPQPPEPPPASARAERM
jgi:hypothetical protein